MKFNNVPIVEKLVNSDQSIALEPTMYKNDLLVPIGTFGKPMYFIIPGKLIKDIVDANTLYE